MSVSPPLAWSAPPRSNRGAGRIVALLLGLLLLLPGLALLGGGRILLWAHHVQRTDGFVVSPEEHFVSAGHALVSERTDLGTGLDWLPLDAALGDACVEVTGTGPSEVFIGIAPEADAGAYVNGVRRTVVDDLGFDGPATDPDHLPGGAPSGPPTDQESWTAEATWASARQVTWNPADGNWVFVLMNADSSSGVYVRARIGASFPHSAVSDGAC